MTNPFEKLEPLISEYCTDQEPHIFLHPYDFGTNSFSPGKRDYTKEELEALEKRDFETRIFMSATAINGNSMWLRSHWTDNHIYESELNLIRDYFKASHGTKNFTAAKFSLTEVLTMCMESKKTNYYSFAVTVASMLSDMGKNTSFQIHDAIVKSEDQVDIARNKLCLLMHIVFSKMDVSNFLYAGEGSNIYRLVYCTTYVSEKDRMKFLFPLFSFLLQLTLTYFVLVENITEQHFMFKSLNPDPESGEDAPTMIKIVSNLLLGVVTLVYSGIVASPSFAEMTPAFKFYEGYGVLQLMDAIVNAILPIIILVSGFFVSIEKK